MIKENVNRLQECTIINIPFYVASDNQVFLQKEITVDSFLCVLHPTISAETKGALYGAP